MVGRSAVRACDWWTDIHRLLDKVVLVATRTKSRLLGKVSSTDRKVDGDVEMTDVALHAAVYDKTRRSISDDRADSLCMHLIRSAKGEVKGHMYVESKLMLQPHGSRVGGQENFTKIRARLCRPGLERVVMYKSQHQAVLIGD